MYYYPELGSHQRNNPKLVYSLDFDVTPHQLRYTYITNLIYYGIDPKTVQYPVRHENSKITMDIYAKVKYNKPKELIGVVNKALKEIVFRIQTPKNPAVMRLPGFFMPNFFDMFD